ncbi:hypothetical protein NDU88_005418 [Pleurodeles waltl]|uniref:Uncharacterized protein n=1 Tax=Pleurodeles waltl TaxID=8319 RepID=A0AAV7UI29_PLEWA|nr:hypothetical protein NDU88_005418 [Pleurodeles waltl]
MQEEAQAVSVSHEYGDEDTTWLDNDEGSVEEGEIREEDGMDEEMARCGSRSRYERHLALDCGTLFYKRGAVPGAQNLHWCQSGAGSGAI